MQEDKRMKHFLVLQSFCPLFVLVFVLHVGHWDLVFRFFGSIIHGDWSVIEKGLRSSFLGDVIITMFCIMWFLITAIVAIGFKNLQDSNYASHGEMIIIEHEMKDSGAMFFVSFIIPLLVEDVSTLRGFLFFIILLSMVIYLLIQSDLFYQNPVLVALQYKSFEFRFLTPYKDVKQNKKYIGISKGEIPFDEAAIKRKYISDDVFLIYNE